MNSVKEEEKKNDELQTKTIHIYVQQTRRKNTALTEMYQTVTFVSGNGKKNASAKKKNSRKKK